MLLQMMCVLFMLMCWWNVQQAAGCDVVDFDSDDLDGACYGSHLKEDESTIIEHLSCNYDGYSVSLTKSFEYFTSILFCGENCTNVGGNIIYDEYEYTNYDRYFPNNVSEGNRCILAVCYDDGTRRKRLSKSCSIGPTTTTSTEDATTTNTLEDITTSEEQLTTTTSTEDATTTNTLEDITTSEEQLTTTTSTDATTTNTLEDITTSEEQLTTTTTTVHATTIKTLDNITSTSEYSTSLPESSISASAGSPVSFVAIFVSLLLVLCGVVVLAVVLCVCTKWRVRARAGRRGLKDLPFEDMPFDDHFEPQISPNKLKILLTESLPSIYNSLYQEPNPETWTKEQSRAPHSSSLLAPRGDTQYESDHSQHIQSYTYTLDKVPSSSNLSRSGTGTPHSSFLLAPRGDTQYESDHSQHIQSYTYTLDKVPSSSNLSRSGTGAPQHADSYDEDSSDDSSDDSVLSTGFVVESKTRNTHTGFPHFMDTEEEWERLSSCSDSRQTEPITNTCADLGGLEVEDEGYLEHEKRERPIAMDNLQTMMACEEFETSLMSPGSEALVEKASDNRSLKFLHNSNWETSACHNVVFDFNSTNIGPSSPSHSAKYFPTDSPGLRDGRNESAVQSVFELSPPQELSQQDAPQPLPLSLGFVLDQGCSSDDYCTSSSSPSFLLDCPVHDGYDTSSDYIVTESIDTSYNQPNLMVHASILTSNVLCLEGSANDDRTARDFGDHRAMLEKVESEEEEEFSPLPLPHCDLIQVEHINNMNGSNFSTNGSSFSFGQSTSTGYMTSDSLYSAGSGF